MGIEEKRRALKISREFTRDPNSQRSFIASTVNQPENKSNIQSIDDPIKNRISTNLSNRYLGKNFYPSYIDSQKNKDFIVAGCGESISQVKDLSDYIVIGTNDIERILTPNYLVVVNHQRTFARGRWEWVQKSLSPVIISHLENPGVLDMGKLVKINLGTNGTPNLDDKSKVDFTMNSPYMGVILAYQMGAKKIGIIGVDFTPHHFFGKTGNHVLNRSINDVNKQYEILGNELTKKGVKIANLSNISLISSWPKMDLEKFRQL